MNDPVALNGQFGIANVATFDVGKGGLTRLTIKSSAAQAEVYLHGAHVTRFVPKNQPPVLFMSEKSQFQAGKAIRGGVPICFPWFGPKAGDAKAPAHGFARLMEWNVESVAQQEADIAVILSLSSSEQTRALWPADFCAKYLVTVGAQLQLSLAIVNTGKEPIKFEEALHSYFTVGAVEAISIQGLGAMTYLDKMNDATPTSQDEELIRFTGETDRVYLNTQATCIVRDPSLGRTLKIAKTGSDATVIWNPWVNKARGMADFGDDEWPGMVCVETCNVAGHAVVLAPGATHTMTQTVSTLE